MGNLWSYPDSRIVETNYGKIQGRRVIYQGKKQVDAFQGIPYAKPPVGDLRFKKPELPEQWEGVKETKRFGPRSVQAPIFVVDNYVLGPTSEDCLYLNVFAPCFEAPEEGFPVMVFVHGGGFVFGDTVTYGDINICENIVSRDVIFVTIQYRVGYLGFMTTGDSECPGNNGLWDQTAALRWINENIEAFGGNKSNITLLGQSAGGACVDMLHCSPHSTGLFHKVIPMAGTAECRWAFYKNMPEQCRTKAARLGITDFENSKELLEKLRAVPADKFGVNIYKKLDKPDEADFETLPYIDGAFFPASLDELRKRAIPKPMMTGIAKEEGLMFLTDKKPTLKHLNDVIALATRGVEDRDALAKELRSLYITDEILADKDKLMRAMANLVSDDSINAGTLEFCRKTVENQDEPVFIYLFDHCNARAMGMLGWMVPILDATHTGELMYLFKKGLFAGAKLTESDAKVVDDFTTAYTNFAKYSNPNGPDPSKSEFSVEWIPLDKDNCGRQFVFTTKDNYMKDDFFEGRTAKYVEIAAKHRSS